MVSAVENIILKFLFRGSECQLHVLIWILRTYPTHTPLVYVATNEDTILNCKSGHVVDGSGIGRINIHQTPDFCALKVWVFDFCGVLNHGQSLKFSGQNLDFCGKIAKIVKINLEN